MSMDRGKTPAKLLSKRNNKMYMDLTEIVREYALPFLPAKSLFRFRAVCRDWKLQISTPFFAHNQSISCGSTLGFFRQVPGQPPSFVSDDLKACGVPDPTLKFLPEPVKILSASNGLICCQSETADKPYYICNPVTEQWKKLPKPNANHGINSSAVLVFEPSRLSFEADYKLVCAFQSEDFDDATEFEIYSSKEGSWKVCGEICFSPYSEPKCGVHANGVVYWKARGILAYDLTKDRSYLLASYYLSYNNPLGTMNGKLCSVHVSGHSISISTLSNTHANTMQMESRVSMWDPKSRVVLDSKVVGVDASESTPLCVIGNKVLVQKGGKLYVYDFGTKETKAVQDAVFHAHANYTPYVNSLVCL